MKQYRFVVPAAVILSFVPGTAESIQGQRMRGMMMMGKSSYSSLSRSSRVRMYSYIPHCVFWTPVSFPAGSITAYEGAVEAAYNGADYGANQFSNHETHIIPC
jgi:hypothetical protein